MANIYLLRHGETEENLNKIIQGQLDGNLTNLGRKQAFKQGQKFRPVPINLILSSDLKRCVDTTEYFIQGYGSGLNVEYNESLRERHWGDMQGKTTEEVGLKDFQGTEVYDMDNEGILKSAESLASIDRRVENLANEIILPFDGENLVIVSHDFANSYLVNYLLGEGRIMHTLENSKFHHLRIEGGEVKKHAFNQDNPQNI